MKKVFLLMLLCSAFFCASCLKKDDTPLEPSATLRGEASLLSSQIRWTKQIDASLLSGKVYPIRGVSPVLSQNIVTLNASQEKKDPLYPSLPDFFELDLSSMEEEARLTLDLFCKALLSGKDAESFVEEKKLYSLAIFRYDLRMELGKDFALDSFVAGKGYSAKDVYECPVRFYIKDGSYFDSFVYLHKKGDEWKVSQIVFRTF